jgi:hypothetical protein
MNGDSIPDTDHVLRHVNGRLLQGEDIDGSGFRLRENEPNLSFGWMEYYRNHSPDEQIQLIRDTFPLRLKKKDKFAELNVGVAKRHVNSEHPEKKIIDFIEDGIFEDGIPLFPSHCFMTCEPDMDAMIGDLLAECILAKFPAIP